jgi:hypothetical protein
MTLAISDAGWGIIATAALGVAGVLGTFFAPTWSQQTMERRRERRAFRRAQRLVAEELNLMSI